MADFWVKLAVDFCPTKCGEGGFADVAQKIQKEAIRIEPFFRLSRLQQLFCPTALFGVTAERTIVYREPSILVYADTKIFRLNLLSCINHLLRKRKLNLHLQQCATAVQVDFFGEINVL